MTHSFRFRLKQCTKCHAPFVSVNGSARGPITVFNDPVTGLPTAMPHLDDCERTGRTDWVTNVDEWK